MIKNRGRIDYLPHKKVWRVIMYAGLGDIPIGDYHTQEEAIKVLKRIVYEEVVDDGDRVVFMVADIFQLVKSLDSQGEAQRKKKK